jgi:predicted DNA-binding transcriptional regulator YafY
MYRRSDLGHIARALRLLDELRGFKRGRLLTDLAEELDVSVKTIRRDLFELEDAGFEIERPRIEGRAAARLVEKSYSHVMITRRERYSLLAVRSVFQVLHGSPYFEDVLSVLDKLEQRLNPAQREEYAAFDDRFIYVPDGGTKPYEGKEDILDALLTGVLSRKVVRFVYREARGRTQRGHFAPYTMLLYKHGLYVVARRLRRPEDGKHLAEQPDAHRVRVYAAERFTDADHLRHADFTVPPHFRIESVMHGAFGVHVGDPDKAQQVVIEFSKERATYVRSRYWHPSQDFKRLPDGRIRLSFTCTNLTPVVSWVLEWGPHARAIQPQALVQEVVRELDMARAGYHGSPSAPLDS